MVAGPTSIAPLMSSGLAFSVLQMNRSRSGMLSAYCSAAASSVSPMLGGASKIA
jgi:hypothetical protein